LDGALSLNADGLLRLWHPPGDIDLPQQAPARVCAVQPFAPDHDALTDRGMVAAPEETDDVASDAIVFVPKEKALARHLIARAMATTAGLVVIDGQKNAGIDSHFKALRARTDILGTVTKAHGRLFWLRADPDVVTDWQSTPRQVDGFTTGPGVFSADGIDPASRLLLASLPAKLGGHLIDLGAGWGYLSAELARQTDLTRLDLVEADFEALRAARLNLPDARAAFHWADARRWLPDAQADVVVTNPPFHAGKTTDPGLGQAFLAQAARCLRRSGRLFAVANRHLPYEATLTDAFAEWSEIAGDARFKVFSASRPRH
jgi:16S rRNA (guanine1207-N2)-methyltransferase